MLRLLLPPSLALLFSPTTTLGAIPAPDWTSTFSVPVDHFANGLSQPTFKIRTRGFQKHAADDGPIFFYSGNEGSIESFWANTGLPFEWAQEFGAEIVFAEHRYYGESLPFGKDSFSVENLQYLRVEQVLADYAMFMTAYQAEKKTNKKVMVLGGSYGGILAAYLRMKYPTVFHMALAASAPIPQTFARGSEFSFYKTVTEDAAAADAACPGKVREGFAQAKALFEGGEEGLAKIQKTFSLCEQPSADEWAHFMQYARNAWTEMAMCDYPYPASFLAPLPSWPVRAACGKVTNSSLSGLEGLAAAVALPYQTDVSKCLDMKKLFIACADQTGCGTGSDSTAWDYQMCSGDVSILVSSNNQTDMFPARQWGLPELEAYCKRHYQTKPRPALTFVRLGAYHLTQAPDSYTNIIFSNGLLDPWHPGGYLESISDSLVAVKLKLGAHHLDLRESNPADPRGARLARSLEKTYAKKWLWADRLTPAYIAELDAEIKRLRDELAKYGLLVLSCHI